MSSIKVIFQKLPASELDFQKKLKSVSDSGSSDLHDRSALNEIQRLKIKQAAIGPNHFAFLTDDGKICRMGFSMHPSLFGRDKKEKEIKQEIATSINSPSYDIFIANRSRHLNNIRQRGRNLIAGRVRPGSTGRPGNESIDVPEDRIAQCQLVLAGKSRDIIKRELQKTNLDVNMAINNILSRDEGEEPGIASAGLGTLISTFPHSEELFNLIDDPENSGLLDDILGTRRRMIGRPGRIRAGREQKNLSADEPPIKISRSGQMGQSDIHYDILEWWPNQDQSIVFTAIVALHNELLALDSRGRLHQWVWNERLCYMDMKHPGAIFHPKTENLSLLNEEVVQISGSVCRASFITKTNKVGTLCDDSISIFTKFIEQKATLFPEFGQANISTTGLLHVCSQWTILQTKSEIYWWGIIPYEQRIKCIEKMKKNQIGKQENLAVGSLVVMKKQPIYKSGTLAVKLVDNEPTIGQVTADIHKMDEGKLEFKIINDPEDLLEANPLKTKETSESRKRTFDEMESGRTETAKWNLRRVIFFPEGKDEIQGKIIRIDGNICAVSFGNNDSEDNVLDPKTRLLKMDDICLSSKISRNVEIVQKTPRKLNIPAGTKVLAANIDEEGWVHLILNNSNSKKIQYGKYDVGKNETSQLANLPTTVQSFQGPKTSDSPLLDHTFGDCPVILLDALKVHHPLFFNQGKILQDPEWFWLGLPPIRTISSSIYNVPSFDVPKKEKAFVALVVFKRQILTPLLLKNANEVVKALLKVLSENYADYENLAEAIYDEIIDGQRNILHAAIDGSKTKSEDIVDINGLLDKLADSVEAIYDSDTARKLHDQIMTKLSDNSQRVSVIRKPNQNPMKALMDPNMFKWQVGAPVGSWGSEEADNDLYTTHGLPSGQPKEKESSLDILLNSTLIGVKLNFLLKSRDAFGRTPFMYAIHRRSYHHANVLLKKAYELANQTDEPEEDLIRYIYPAGSPLDHNPLYVLCCNDTCSYTWTRDKHIYQDIYECKTCGLTDTLCCCSECARTCHAGHDCVLKITSPSAYCDCLEKCPCRSQEEGDQEQRSNLLESLLSYTNLVEIQTSKGEHLLQFLAQTVARQVKEQTQGKETIENDRMKSSRAKMEGLEERDSKRSLPPPTFCRSALTRVLRDWRAVESLIMNTRDQLCASYAAPKQSLEDQKLLDGQSGSARLDKFTHTLLLKLTASEYLNSLIATIQSHPEKNEVTERLIRSIVRIYTCYSAGIQPAVLSTENQKTSSGTERCKKIFQALPVQSVKQLCLAAESLIRPMRMGAVRPVDSFNLSEAAEDVIINTEELFSVNPMAPKKEKKSSRRRNRNSVRQSERENEFEAYDFEGEPRIRTSVRNRRYVHATNDANYVDDEETDEVDEVLPLLPQEMESEDPNMEVEQEAFDEPPDSPTYSNGENGESQEDEDGGEDHPMEGDGEQEFGDGNHDDTVENIEEGFAEEGEDLDPQLFDDQDMNDDDQEDDIDVQSSDDDHSMDDFNDGVGERPLLNETYDIDSRVVHSSGIQRSSQFNMNWAVREMPIDRATARRHQRWMNETNPSSGADYIGLNQNESSLGRKRGLASAPTLCTVTESQANLARSAAMCIKEVGLILKPEICQTILDEDRASLVETIEKILMPTWTWILTVMDWTESQLRYGSVLNKIGESSSKEGKESKRSKSRTPKSHDFLTYALSLLRQGSSDHADMLPSVDISSLKHIAFVLDAMIYLLKQDFATTLFESSNSKDTIKMSGRRTGFFRRSESMIFLGSNEDENDFDLTYAESLPLSEQPHLLKPNSTKEELFGRPNNKSSGSTSPVDIQTNMALQTVHDMSKPGYLSGHEGNKVEPDGLLSRWRKTVELFARVFMDDVGSEEGSILRQLASFSLRQQKFQKQMEMLRSSVKKSELKIEVSREREKLVPQTIKKLNHEYQRLKEDKEKSKKYPTDKYGGRDSGWGDISSFPSSSTSQSDRIRSSGLLVQSKIKVRFHDEPGEGNGVMRSFFTTIADAFLSQQSLPPMEHIQDQSSSPRHRSDGGIRSAGLSGLSSRLNRGHSRGWDKSVMTVNAEEWLPESHPDDPKFVNKEKIYKMAVGSEFKDNAAKITGMIGSLSSGQLMNCVNDEEQMKLKILEAAKMLKDANYKGTQDMSSMPKDDKPLFYLPGSNQRYYAVEPGVKSMERLNVFRNVGRVIGLSLLHNELCPIPLTRSVVKQILGRKVNWHDLAFYDSDLFESLRKLIKSSKTDPNYLESLDMTFEIVDSDGESVLLIPGGDKLKVMNENIFDYVKRYATYKMVLKPEPAVKELRRGVHDVISESALNGLTPEDWWLLVNGVGTVDVAKLSSLTTFNDESSLNSDVNNVIRFQKWFWEVVEQFSQSERQELLYFWTGAPALRAGEEAFEPSPSVTIRHPNDESLPSANTCISRLYLPLYTSKAILKSKLSMAIKTKTFGFV